MKVTATNGVQGFKPFTVSFTVESEDELKSLKALFQYDCSVPEYLQDVLGESFDRSILTKLFCEIYPLLIQ